MRNLSDSFNRIYCDIDDTLIYGFWTTFMRHSWNILRSNSFSDWCIEMQYRLGLYKVNQKLKHQLDRCIGKCSIIFLTARKENKYTNLMIEKIFGMPLMVVPLATDNPTEDKLAFIEKELCNADKPIIFDDNKELRWEAWRRGYQAFDPDGYLEKLIG